MYVNDYDKFGMFAFVRTRKNGCRLDLAGKPRARHIVPLTR